MSCGKIYSHWLPRNNSPTSAYMQRMSVESSPLLPGFTIAFVNCHSGGRQGTDLIVLLNKLWVGGTGIVVDLCSQQKHPHTNQGGVRFPFCALEGVGTSGLTILSCGGDGTHSWVWSALVSFYAYRRTVRDGVKWLRMAGSHTSKFHDKA